MDETTGSFTKDDLVKVRSAILSLATGEAVTSVTFSSGRSVQYKIAELPQLRELESNIASAVGTKKRFVMATTSKGF